MDIEKFNLNNNETFSDDDDGEEWKPENNNILDCYESDEGKEPLYSTMEPIKRKINSNCQSNYQLQNNSFSTNKSNDMKDPELLKSFQFPKEKNIQNDEDESISKILQKDWSEADIKILRETVSQDPSSYLYTDGFPEPLQHEIKQNLPSKKTLKQIDDAGRYLCMEAFNKKELGEGTSEKWTNLAEALESDRNVNNVFQGVIELGQYEPINTRKRGRQGTKKLPRPDFAHIYDYLQKSFTDQELPELGDIEGAIVFELMRRLQKYKTDEIRQKYDQHLKFLFAVLSQPQDKIELNDHMIKFIEQVSLQSHTLNVFGLPGSVYVENREFKETIPAKIQCHSSDENQTAKRKFRPTGTKCKYNDKILEVTKNNEIS